MTNTTAGLVGEQGFRSLMAMFPTGVAVVTALGSEEEPWGMTCSSLCAVTLAPPTLLVCLRDGSPTLAAVEGRAAFALNLLHRRAQRVAELFASGAPDRFDRVRWQAPREAGGPHLTEDAHKIADCRIRDLHRVGDHAVVFGEVLRVSGESTGPPLLYGMRRYTAWPD
jgi:flavin reductase (DIM6/NTAB) family NADH-FMN oxidoreductase RutF